MGIGSDSGGCVGIPASYNGVCSLKPSTRRLSFKGAPRSGGANPSIPDVAGLLGPSVASLKLLFKSLLSTEAWKRDPDVLPFGYRDQLEHDLSQGTKPHFGLVKDDGIVRPHPPIARALDMVEKALETVGIQTVPWGPASSVDAEELHGPIIHGEGCPDAYANLQLSGEAIVAQIAHLFPDGNPKRPMGHAEWEQVVESRRSYRVRDLGFWMTMSNLVGGIGAYIQPITPTAAVIPGKFLNPCEYSLCHLIPTANFTCSLFEFSKCPRLLLHRHTSHDSKQGN